MLEMAINNVEVGSEKDRVHIVTFCDISAIRKIPKYCHCGWNIPNFLSRKSIKP